MLGLKSQTPITLPEAEAQHLHRLVRARNLPHGQVVRAQIVLPTPEYSDWFNQVIDHALELTARIVLKWRRRWLEMHTLDDLPRPGAPRRFFYVRARATAVACSLPHSHGVALSRWRGSEIAQGLQQIQVIPSIAVSTIRRWRAAERLHPWCFHL